MNGLPGCVYVPKVLQKQQKLKQLLQNTKLLTFNKIKRKRGNWLQEFAKQKNKTKKPTKNENYRWKEQQVAVAVVSARGYCWQRLAKAKTNQTQRMNPQCFSPVSWQISQKSVGHCAHGSVGSICAVNRTVEHQHLFFPQLNSKLKLTHDALKHTRRRWNSDKILWGKLGAHFCSKEP